MGKLLLLLVVIAVALVALRLWARKAAAPAERSVPPPEDMVRCLHCGVHLPRGEAVANERGFFCSEAHGREPPAH